MLPENAHKLQISPAPWQLKGEGYVLLYRFSNHFLQQAAGIPNGLKPLLKLNFGAVMLVNYQDSPVGPYGELLLMPGMFKVSGQFYWHISKIYVSSLDSVYNGRENWGIPKELANFTFTNTPSNEHLVQVEFNGQTVFNGLFKNSRMGFPISTSILPFRFFQPLQDKQYVTTPIGKGNAHVSKLSSLKIGAGLFPNITSQHRLLSLYIPNFQLTFPIPSFIE